MTPAPLSGVLEAAIYVDDLAAAEAFYAGTLGLPVVLRREGAHVFFRCGTTIVLAFRPEVTRAQKPEGPLPVPPHGATGAGHLCLAVDGVEMDAWQARLTSEGVAIEAEFAWPNGARSIYFRDPAGNSIELAEPRLWSPA